MGFYLRKAFSFGPLRLNLSRSGLGASIGVTGARIGVGPRGSYVHLGRGGLYYRQTLGAPGRSRPRPPSLAPQTTLPEVESRSVTEMHDTSSAELLNELNRVQSRIPLVSFALIGFIVMMIAMILIETRMTDIARPLSSQAAALTDFPDALSTAEILRERYVARLRRAEQAKRQADASLRWQLYLAFGAAFALGIVLLLYARHRDVIRGTAVLTYDLEVGAQKWFTRLIAAFTEFASCEKVWHIPAKGETDDWKRHAGATALVDRQVVMPTLSLPRRVLCNFQVPSLKAGRQTLYFFPDRLLVYESGSVGAVAYSALTASASESKFREEDPAPSDAKSIGMTWRYVNKDGGPDRRFNNNTQIPIMRYGSILFTSPTGLNELFQCSRPEAAEKLVVALKSPSIER
jgi:hypothetical protein